MRNSDGITHWNEMVRLSMRLRRRSNDAGFLNQPWAIERAGLYKNIASQSILFLRRPAQEKPE